MALFRVKWYHTEMFEADIEIPDEELEQPDDYPSVERDDLVREKLEEIIVGMDQKELSLAFDGCTEREIEEVKELESKEEQ